MGSYKRASALVNYMTLSDIRIPAVLLSLLISVWIMYNTDIVNGDAVLYISAAQHIETGNWSSACNLPGYKCWIFYSALIALVAKISNLGLESSAYLLNALFSALMVFVFLSLVRIMGAGLTTQLIAAFVILFHPYLNENKADIIRDHGYWAFYLAMLYFFIKFWQRLNWKYAIAWSLSAIIASLFRIEGVLFLFLLPLILILHPVQKLSWRVLYFLKANTIQLLIITILTCRWLIDPSYSVQKLGRLYDPIQYMNVIWWQFTNGLNEKAQLMIEYVFGQYIDDYALLSIWVTLIIVIVSKIVNTLTPLYVALPLWGKLREQFKPSADIMKILLWVLVINMFIIMATLLARFVLSGRFVVPLVLVVMLGIPFMLTAIYDMWCQRSNLKLKNRLIFPFILVLLIFMTVDGLYSFDKNTKVYLRDAGRWLMPHIQDGRDVYMDDKRLSYYSGLIDAWNNTPARKATEELLHGTGWRGFDYIAIHVTKDDSKIQKTALDLLGPPVREFRNSNQHGVLIYGAHIE